MPKKAHRENFRVEVYPRNPGDFGCGSISGCTQTEKEWEQACQDILDQIKRHVDGLPHRHAVGDVVWDTIGVCSFCDRSWTEDSDKYNGGCCDEDEDGNPERSEGATL